MPVVNNRALAASALLTPALETLMELTYPISWPNVLIPVMPASLVDFLEAFVPYLFGTTSATLERFMDEGAVPEKASAAYKTRHLQKCGRLMLAGWADPRWSVLQVALIDLDHDVIRNAPPLPQLPLYQELVDTVWETLGSLTDPRSTCRPPSIRARLLSGDTD